MASIVNMNKIPGGFTMDFECLRSVLNGMLSQISYVFDDKPQCESFIAGNTLPLIMQLQGAIGNMLAEFHEFQCLTEQEAIDANIALGHTIPDRPETGKKI